MAAKIKPNSWIVTVPVVAGAVAFLYFFYLPGHRAIGEVRSDLKERQHYITTASRLSVTLTKARAAIKKYRQQAADWDAAAPTDREIARLLGRIHALAGDTGATVTNFDPEPPSSMARLRRIPVGVTCTGSFEQVYAMVAKLENQPETIWIEHLTMESSERDGQSVLCEMDLVIFANNPEISNQAKDST